LEALHAVTDDARPLILPVRQYKANPIMKKIIIIYLFFSFQRLIAYEVPIYFVNNRYAGTNYIVKDFYMYNYSDSYIKAYARLSYSGSNYRQFVSMTISLFKNGNLVSNKESFANFETYGSSGMLPGTETFLDYFIEKTDFDSVSFNISYLSSDGSEPRFNKNALSITDTVLEPFFESTYRISGILKNMSAVTLRFPSVFICLYSNQSMLLFQQTFADAPENNLESNQTATFDTFIDLPDNYDSLRYVPNYSPSLTGPVSISNISDKDIAPKYFDLSQNYPNPFNVNTTIVYTLNYDMPIKLYVYDLNGNIVDILVSEIQNTGYHSITWDASGQPSGIYFYCLESGPFKKVKSALLIK
jgi:hypothetical protein